MLTQLLLHFIKVQMQQPLNYLEDVAEKFLVLFGRLSHSFSNTLLKDLVSRSWTTITNKMAFIVLTVPWVHAYLFLNFDHFGILHCSSAFCIATESIWCVFSLRVTNDKVFASNTKCGTEQRQSYLQSRFTRQRKKVGAEDIKPQISILFVGF